MKKLENWFLDPWDFLIERGSAGNNEKVTKSRNVRGLKALFCCSSARILKFMVSNQRIAAFCITFVAEKSKVEKSAE